MLVNSMMYNCSSFYFSSFDILDKKDDYACEKKDSYDGDEGYRIPNPDSGLFFERSDDRCLASERIRCIRDIELHLEVV